jgi:hypothetical protein
MGWTMGLADAMRQGWTIAKFSSHVRQRCNLLARLKESEGRERANRSEETDALSN